MSEPCEDVTETELGIETRNSTPIASTREISRQTKIGINRRAHNTNGNIKAITATAAGFGHGKNGSSIIDSSTDSSSIIG